MIERLHRARIPVRTAVTRRVLPPAVAISLLMGCQGPTPTAREQANRNWNLARAEVKARLAADQLAVGNVAGAAAELAEADRLCPDLPGLLPLRARVWLAAGRVEDAAELLAEATARPDASAELHYLLGVAQQQQQQWDAARASFGRAAELDPSQLTYVTATTQAWLQLGQPDVALNWLTRYESRFGWTAGYYAAVAECYEQTGDWPAAANAWRRVLAVPGAGPDLRERLAIALYRADRWTEAADVLHELLSDSTAEHTVGMRLLLADCHLALGRVAEAMTELNGVLRTDPLHAGALCLLARCQAESGRLELAVQTARQAAAATPQDTATLELLAALAWRAGYRDVARDAARQLQALEPGNAVAARIRS